MEESLWKIVSTDRELGMPAPPIQCADGFHISVQASAYHYSLDYEHRRLTFLGFPPPAPKLPWTSLECGFPSERPEPWENWQEFADDPDDPTGTVYAFVPVGMVAALIQSHGGEAQ